MSTPHDRPGSDAADALQSLSAVRTECGGDIQRLGEELNAQADAVVAGMLRRSRESGVVLPPSVEQSFVRVGTVSTVAVARWMAGEGPEVAREVGEESWKIFGQLAAHHAAPLNEVTKRCLRWRDAARDVVCDVAARLELPDPALDEAMAMLQRSLDVTLVRMCQAFESERQRAQEELDQRQEELAFMATHDTLTGLTNRKLILERGDQMLVRARRSQTPVAALFIDLDNFKQINDTLGHVVGDQLLCAVAARLAGVVRNIDALGRLGGDEFVVVVEGMSLAAGPELVAERLLAALRQPFDLEGAFKLEGTESNRLLVTASIGIAMGDRPTAEELLRDADIAMYQAKWEGKNRYVVFEPVMQDTVQTRMELETDMRGVIQTRMDLQMELHNAFEKGELFLVYHPMFDLSQMVVSGMEALIRWRHPKRGIVQPEALVPLLEETGLIAEVGRWVLEEACMRCTEWRAAGHPVGVAVNVAPRQLDREGFIKEVSDALSASRLDPDALMLEITETTIMSNAEEAARRLAAIKELGVRVAIDDFGTGYSSLAYLQHFPVDVLKIDRSFISRLHQGVDGETLIRTLIQLGKSLSIETVAEGIEETRELSLLREERCDTGQGFLFTQPLDVEECESFLCEWDSKPSSATSQASHPAA